VVRALTAIMAAALVGLSTAAGAGAIAWYEDTEHQVFTASFTYIPPENLIAEGDSLTHTNVDSDPHDLTSDDLGPDGTPWFQSELIGPGESAPVPVEDLPPGVFPYYCSIHPFMRGTLRVDEVPAVPPDPPQTPGTPELPEPAESGDLEVASSDNIFTPATLTVPVGTTISWGNVGTSNHTVTAADGSWDSSPLCPTTPLCHTPGDIYRRTFDAPGTFAYYCKLHGTAAGTGHAGTVVVEPPGSQPTTVDFLDASLSDGEVGVSGRATFRGEAPVALATDPPGDGPGAPEVAESAGIDLLGASAYQPDPRIPSLFFEWKMTELPSTGSLPEVIRYTIPFQIDDTGFRLHAKLSDAAAPRPDDPDGGIAHRGYAFELRGNCEDLLGGCEHVAWLTGSFDRDRALVRVKVPLGVTLAFVPGAPLERNDSAEPSQLFIQAAVEGASPVAADFAAWGDDDPAFAYRIPGREVLLGIAPAGTPASEVELDTPATVGPDGVFAGGVAAPGPGDWDVWARACFGTSCSSTARQVSI
jgi:plastocyanin